MLPIEKPFDKEEGQKEVFVSPLNSNKPISIETALIYGEVDRFYNIVEAS